MRGISADMDNAGKAGQSGISGEFRYPPAYMQSSGLLTVWLQAKYWQNFS
jgi:hypothetical protein